MPESFRKPLPLLAAFLALSLGACAEMAPLYPPALADRLQLGDRSLAVDGINESRTAGGVPRIAVYGHSVADFSQNVRYRVKWYDAGGIPLESAVEAWQEKRVEARAPYEFVAVGPGPQAVRYTVEIGPR